MTNQAKEARRRRGVELLRAGHSKNDVALALQVSEAAVCLWDRMDRRHGPDGLQAKTRQPRIPRLPLHLIENLPSLLLQGPRKFGFPGDDWRLHWIAELLQNEYEATYAISTLSPLLRDHGIEWRKPYIFKHREQFALPGQEVMPLTDPRQVPGPERT